MKKKEKKKKKPHCVMFDDALDALDSRERSGSMFRDVCSEALNLKLQAF